MPPVVMPEAARVLFAGDWHGAADAAEAALYEAAGTGCDAVVQLGDFGFWHGQEGQSFLDRVSAASRTAGIPVYWIDGNHENFDLLDPLPIDPHTGLRTVAENVHHLPRGSRWQWAGLAFAALGGATSVDKQWRTPGHNWWPQEAITDRQAETVAAEGPADVLLVHDCPSGVRIAGIHRAEAIKFWPARDLEIAWAHQDLLARVVEEVRPGRLLHGHFHVRYDTEAVFGGKRCLVSGLDCDGSGPDNRLVVDLADWAGDRG